MRSERLNVEDKKRIQSGDGGLRSLDAAGPEGVGQTPNIDSLLERFVVLDYLLRDKIEELEAGRKALAEEDGKVIERGEFCG